MLLDRALGALQEYVIRLEQEAALQTACHEPMRQLQAAAEKRSRAQATVNALRRILERDDAQGLPGQQHSRRAGPLVALVQELQAQYLLEEKRALAHLRDLSPALERLHKGNSAAFRLVHSLASARYGSRTGGGSTGGGGGGQVAAHQLVGQKVLALLQAWRHWTDTLAEVTAVVRSASRAPAAAGSTSSSSGGSSGGTAAAASHASSSNNSSSSSCGTGSARNKRKGRKRGAGPNKPPQPRAQKQVLLRQGGGQQQPGGAAAATAPQPSALALQLEDWWRRRGREALETRFGRLQTTAQDVEQLLVAFLAGRDLSELREKAENSSSSAAISSSSSSSSSSPSSASSGGGGGEAAALGLQLDEEPRDEPAENRVGAMALRRVRAKLSGYDPPSACSGTASASATSAAAGPAASAQQHVASSSGRAQGKQQPGSRRRLAVQQQVEALIAEATDATNLCRMYEGWAPWL